MSSIKTIIGSVLLLFIATSRLTGQDVDQMEREKRICDYQGLGLPGEVPPILAAILNYGCAAQLYEDGLPELQQQVADIGYLSILLQDRSASEVQDFVELVIENGERGYLTYDGGVEDVIDRIQDEPLRSRFQSFYLSARSETSDGEDQSTYMKSLPVWEEGSNRDTLVEYCTENDCNDGPSSCDGQITLQDKLSIVEGRRELDDFVKSCDITREWLTALRYTGLVDTDCSDPWQMNRGLRDIKTITEACFPEDLDLSTVPAMTPFDVAAFMRDRWVQGKLGDLSEADIERISGFYPAISEYLEGHSP